jgi:hypothetical protein
MASSEDTPVEITQPVDSSSAYLGFRFESSVRAFYLTKDRKNRMRAIPVLLITPTAGTSPMKVIPGTNAYIKDANTGYDAFVDNSNIQYGTTGLDVNARMGLYNPAGTYPIGNAIEIQRTPTTWKVGNTAAAGQTALWTPTAGKKFRILGGVLMLSKEATCAGAFAFGLQDGAGANVVYFNISAVALAAIGACTIIPLALPGNGYPSTAINNVLNFNLGAALTAGLVSASVWGTEE